MRGLFASRRSRLAAMLVVATAAVSVLVVAAAGSSLSYYVPPEEYLARSETSGARWRVAGRVIGESIEEQRGRPVAFTIRGDEGGTVRVRFDGGFEIALCFGQKTRQLVRTRREVQLECQQLHRAPLLQRIRVVLIKSQRPAGVLQSGVDLVAGGLEITFDSRKPGLPIRRVGARTWG